MTIKQQGGIFGRNPSFNDIEANSADVRGLLKVSNEHNDNFIQLSSTTTADEAFVKLSSTDLVIDHDPTGARSSSDIVLNSDGVEVLRVKNGASGGDLEPLGNVVMADGKGIDFSATSGTGTSELFDDYEEGTWTPVYNNAGSVTYDIQNGYYRKIGSVVVAGFTVSASSMSATAGNTIEIGGLPFASSSDANIPLAQRGTFEAIFFTVDGTTSYDLAIAGASNTALQIRKMSNGGGNVASTYSEMTSQTDCQIRGMITYIV